MMSATLFLLENFQLSSHPRLTAEFALLFPHKYELAAIENGRVGHLFTSFD